MAGEKAELELVYQIGPKPVTRHLVGAQDQHERQHELETADCQHSGNADQVYQMRIAQGVVVADADHVAKRFDRLLALACGEEKDRQRKDQLCGRQREKLARLLGGQVPQIRCDNGEQDGGQRQEGK